MDWPSFIRPVRAPGVHRGRTPTARTWTCIALSALAIAPSPAVDWPQWRGPDRRGIWTENLIVREFDDAAPKIVWRAPVGAGYSGPTVAKGRVYVMDKVDKPEESERIHCLDAETGRSIWSHTYACRYQDVDYGYGPRASVTIDGGRAFSIGTMGIACALDAASGEVLWQRDLREDYAIDMPIWGIAASPLVEAGTVIVQIGGRDGACWVGLDALTGADRWRALDERASYSSPIVVDQAGERIVVAWSGESLSGLRPATGEVVWTHATKPDRWPDNVMTPVFEWRTRRLFISSFLGGSRMFHLPEDRLAIVPLWERKGRNERETDALHVMSSTPIFDGDYLYGLDSYGEFRCLEAATGDRLWEDATPAPQERWSTLHIVHQPDADHYWIFNELGELIIARLSRERFEEVDVVQLIEPTTPLRQRPAGVVAWSHPAFANRCIFVRNDREILCADLSLPAAR